MNKFIRTHLSSLQLLIILGVVFVVGILLFPFYQRNVMTEIRVSGGTHHEGVVGIPRFINPVLAQSRADRDLTELVYSSLLHYDADTGIEYQLAEEVSISEDGETYLINLDPEARFSDGSEVRAEDLVFTIEKIQDPLIKSPYLNEWIGVDAETVGSHTVRLNLNESFPDFIHHLDIGILPEHIWGDVNADEFAFHELNIHPIGSGPYQVTGIEFSSQGIPNTYILGVNPYHHTSPYIEQFIIRTYRTQDELFAAYENGNVTGMVLNHQDRYNFTDEQSSDETEHILPQHFGIFFNTDSNENELTGPVRRALSSAIDRQRIVEDIFNGQVSIISLPDGSDGFEYNTARARSLIESEDWRQNSDGLYLKSIDGENTPLSFNLAIPDVTVLREVAGYVAEDLRAIGVVVNIQAYPPDELTNEIIRARNYDALLFGYQSEKSSDWFAFWHSSQKNDPGLNVSMFDLTATDQLLETIRDGENLNQTQQEFIDIWIEESPAILLYAPHFRYINTDGPELPSSLNDGSDRFIRVHRWYKDTRHVWNFLIDDEDDLLTEIEN